MQDRGRAKWPIRKLALAAALAMLAGIMPASEASAGKPKLGRWEGTGPDGGHLSFRVMRVKGSGGDLGLSYLAQSCPGEFESGLTFTRMSFWASGDAWSKPGDRPGPPNALAIRRGGRLAKRYRDPITAPGTRYESPYRGRLGRRSGRVRVGEPGSNDPCGGRYRVHHVDAAAAPVSGIWHALGAVGTEFRFLVFGSAVDRYVGQVLTGTGTLRGAPVPCIAPLGFVDSPEGLPAWIDPGGSFAYVDQNEPPAAINGHFDSQTSLSGRYKISPGLGTELTLNCVTLELPFTASLEAAARAPRLHGHRLVGEGGRPPTPQVSLPTPSQPTQYVALGDSYSSGEGVPPFERENKRCHRSNRSYPALFNPPGYSIERASFACSGATTLNVGQQEAAGLTGVPQKGEPAMQLERLSLAQWRPTDLITITVGGNDAHFGSVVFKCLVRGPCHRGRAARRTKERIAKEVPASLAKAYAGIRSRVPHRPRGPNTTVVVLGYPQLFPERLRRRCTIQGRVITPARQRFLRERGEQLNEVIRAQAAAAGFHYVDVTKAFKGHEVCGRKKSWLHGLRLPRHKYSYHPTGRGQRAYARRLVRYFGCLHQKGFGFRPSGVPFNPGRGLVVPRKCPMAR